MFVSKEHFFLMAGFAAGLELQSKRGREVLLVKKLDKKLLMLVIITGITTVLPRSKAHVLVCEKALFCMKSRHESCSFTSTSFLCVIVRKSVLQSSYFTSAFE